MNSKIEELNRFATIYIKSLAPIEIDGYEQGRLVSGERLQGLWLDSLEDEAKPLVIGALNEYSNITIFLNLLDLGLLSIQMDENLPKIIENFEDKSSLIMSLNKPHELVLFLFANFEANYTMMSFLMTYLDVMVKYGWNDIDLKVSLQEYNKNGELDEAINFYDAIKKVVFRTYTSFKTGERYKHQNIPYTMIAPVVNEYNS